MNLKELIDKLQTSIDCGQNPEAEVEVWDPDMDTWGPITVIMMYPKKVRFYTDEP